MMTFDILRKSKRAIGADVVDYCNFFVSIFFFFSFFLLLSWNGEGVAKERENGRI